MMRALVLLMLLSCEAPLDAPRTEKSEPEPRYTITQVGTMDVCTLYRIERSNGLSSWGVTYIICPGGVTATKLNP